MFPYLYAGFCVAGLFIAAYTDIKERIVPNKLTFALIAIGLLLHAAESFFTNSFYPIYFSVAGGVLMLFVALALWRIGAWAGGDVKLFTAFGTLVPLPFIGAFPGFYTTYPLFPLLILLNTVILSFPFVMLYVFFKTVTHEKLRNELPALFKKILIKGVVSGLAVFGVSMLVVWAALPTILVIPLLVALFFIPFNARFAIAAILSALFLLTTQDANLFIATIGAVTFLAAVFEMMTFGRNALHKTVKVSDLKTGEIPAFTYYFDKKVKTFVPSLWNAFQEPKRVIVSCLNAGGVEKSGIAALKKHKVKNILIKESIPLVPILLLGAVASLLLGDLAWIAVSLL